MQDYSPIITPDVGLLAQVVRQLLIMRNDDVAELNNLLELRGYQSGFCHSTLSITASYAAGVGDLYIDADATSGAVTVTLHPTPLDGQTHYVAKNDATGNAVTLAGNGHNINGSATLALSSQYDTACVVYMGGAGEWRIL